MTGITLQPHGLLQQLVHGPTIGSKLRRCNHHDGINQVLHGRWVLFESQRLVVAERIEPDAFYFSSQKTTAIRWSRP
jgi:hypothetical protein